MEMEMEDDSNMDSLFEGMVLFTPSQLADDDADDDQRQEEAQVKEQQQQDHLGDVQRRPTTQTNDHDEDESQASSSSSSFAFSSSSRARDQEDQREEEEQLKAKPQEEEKPPLDENLFSDLTLITPILTLTTTQSQSSPSPPPASDSASHPSFSQFERIKIQISDKLRHVRDLAASVSVARKDAIRRRRSAADHLHSASAAHALLESQLQDACEAEDFEKAELISDRLSAAEMKRQTLLHSLKEAESRCDAIDSQMEDVLNSQIAAERECASVLYNFARDAEQNADLILRRAGELASKEIDEWFLSTESLEATKIELDIVSHLINDARLAAKHSIEHFIEDDRKEKEALCKRKDILTDELQRLIALVKEKEKEIAQYDARIEAVDDRIASVLMGFQGTRSIIDSEYDNLQSSISQMHQQSEALLTKKEEIDKSLAKEENCGTQLRDLAIAAEDEAKGYEGVVQLRETMMLSIVKSLEDKVRMAKIEEKLIEDVQSLQQEASAARISLQDLSSTKSNIQQNISSYKQKIIFIDKRVPELEAEKKVAAAARNFKEAARIAAEVKSFSIEKDTTLFELEKATSEMEMLENGVRDTISRLHDTEQLILSKEKEVASTKFQRLLLAAGMALAERSAALELGNVEEANLLLAEAEAASAEADKLKTLYSIKEDEFPNLPKRFISMELVSNLGKKQLAELAASVDVHESQLQEAR